VALGNYPLLSAEIKERQELYLSYPSGPSWLALHMLNFTFELISGLPRKRHEYCKCATSTKKMNATDLYFSKILFDNKNLLL